MAKCFLTYHVCFEGGGYTPKTQYRTHKRINRSINQSINQSISQTNPTLEANFILSSAPVNAQGGIDERQTTTFGDYTETLSVFPFHSKNTLAHTP